jgi:hypothetical protein
LLVALPAASLGQDRTRFSAGTLIRVEPTRHNPCSQIFYCFLMSRSMGVPQDDRNLLDGTRHSFVYYKWPRRSTTRIRMTLMYSTRSNVQCTDSRWSRGSPSWLKNPGPGQAQCPDQVWA